jgi:excisionase family DNA binding protein
VTRVLFPYHTLVIPKGEQVPEPLLTPEALAELVGVPLKTIYRWNFTGDGPPPVHVGRHVRYRPQDVDEWIHSRTEHRDPARSA